MQAFSANRSPRPAVAVHDKGTDSNRYSTATSLHVDMSTPYSETKGLVVNNEAPAVITTPGLPMAVSRIVGTVYGHRIKNKPAISVS